MTERGWQRWKWGRRHFHNWGKSTQQPIQSIKRHSLWNAPGICSSHRGRRGLCCIPSRHRWTTALWGTEHTRSYISKKKVQTSAKKVEIWPKWLKFCRGCCTVYSTTKNYQTNLWAQHLLHKIIHVWHGLLEILPTHLLTMQCQEVRLMRLYCLKHKTEKKHSWKESKQDKQLCFTSFYFLSGVHPQQ